MRNIAMALNETQPIVLRSYQQEMFERSCEGNTIIVMETNSGKTPVAIHRMMHALESSNSDKIVWFLTQGVSLCKQQYKATCKAIPTAVVQIVVGDGPDLWGSLSTWTEILQGVDIVFSTFAVLHSALEHAYVQFERISLLVFDEAHHVAKKHPANKIMQDFYHRKQVAGASALPAILGLTASPAQNGKLNKISQLELNLAAVCKTPRRHRLELRRYVHRPTLCRLTYQVDVGVELDLVSATFLDAMPLNASQRFGERVEKLKRKVEHLINELGLWAALNFLESLAAKLKVLVEQHSSAAASHSVNEKRQVLELLHPLIAKLKQFNLTLKVSEQRRMHVTAKMKCLIKHLNLLAERQGSRLMAIIFVRQRVVAAMMSSMLSQHPDVINGIRTGVFVGESNCTSYDKDISELVVPRTQLETLESFRAGGKNLIIATDSLDEGIDVAACNAIICFDPPQNLRSFIQKRGRARQEQSFYTIMVSSEDATMSPRTFEENEKFMSELIEQELRLSQLALQQEAVPESVNYVLHSVTSGAYMTAQSTKQHLEHFCAKLPRIPYTCLRPSFSCEPTAGGFINARVDLPMSVPPTARSATSSKAWQTERAAIADAAFQAYQGLYKLGLLTEHLLPLEIESFPEDDLKMQKQQFYHLHPKVQAWDSSTPSSHVKELFCTLLIIRNEHTGWVGERLLLWTFTDLSSVGTLHLRAENDQSIAVELQPSTQVSIESEHILETLNSCTQILSMAARCRPIHGDTDFAVLVTPALALPELSIWLQQQRADTPAIEIHAHGNIVGQELVMNTARGGSLHVFHAWSKLEDEEGGSVLEVECSPFPARKNFLNIKTTQSTLAPEDWESGRHNSAFFPPEDCVFKGIEIKWAWTMRFVPSILYRVEQILLAERLQQHLLSPVKFQSPSAVVTAITSPATMLYDNYERLEFLGDSVLKFHTSQQLYCEHSHWHEEFLTRMRSRIVSNINLAKAAVNTGIDRFIIHEPFVGKDWSMPSVRSASKQLPMVRYLNMKVVADVVEALIGSAYLHGGISNAQCFMSTLIPEIRKEQILFTKSPHGVDESNKLVEYAELVIGYSFRHKYLLMEALTHPSCTRDLMTEPYQRLEYLGDAVLDFLVATEIFDMLPQASQSQLTRIKAALVNGDFLAFLCYGCSEARDVTTYPESKAEDARPSVNRKSQGLWMMMRCEANEVARARQQGFDRYAELQGSIFDALTSSKRYPWEKLCMLQAPKFVSDLVESVIGAIFVDAQGDLGPCRVFLEKIQLMHHLRRIVTAKMDVKHPKEMLNNLLHGRKVDLIWAEDNKTVAPFSVRLLVDGEEAAIVDECASKDEATMQATIAACRHLILHDL